jgi:transcription elongation factor Elf1
MSHFDSYDEDEAKQSEKDDSKGRKKEFDCPGCNANNPTEEPVAEGQELLCNYCGSEYLVRLSSEGRIKLKEI